MSEPQAGASSEKLYRIDESPGKGKGMFAASDIEQGQEILSEQPVIFISETEHSMVMLGDRVMTCFAQSLSEPDRSTFMTLSYHAGDEARQLNETGDPVRAHLLTEFLASLFPYESDAKKYLALETARVNHSCIPNARVVFNSETGVSHLRAITDINKNNEILISYCPRPLRKEQRAEILRRSGFQCLCELCGSNEGSPRVRNWNMLCDKLDQLDELQVLYNKGDQKSKRPSDPTEYHNLIGMLDDSIDLLVQEPALVYHRMEKYVQ